ncbi:MAG: dihydrofolate reductase [Proteobacteria bacterium]|nr:dihydrofolate reductase [Pseudomonadota bacterium]
MKTVLVAAVAKNGVIGADNRLLWRLKSDMKHFRALTMGRPMIMGRKTFESIGKPLPGRHTIILTRDTGFTAEGAEIALTMEQAKARAIAFAQAAGQDEIIIAGGGEIYAAFLPMADRLEITEIDLEPEGDARFPAIDRAVWRETERRAFTKSADDEAAFAFVTYLRR